MCLTVQLRVQFAQVGGDSGDEDLNGGVCRTDLEPRLIGQHGQHWRHTEPVSQQLNQLMSESLKRSATCSQSVSQ